MKTWGIVITVLAILGFTWLTYAYGPFQFALAPTFEAEKSMVVALGETKEVNGVSITPTSVIEDSRCPIDVQCIQAGTVRVAVVVRHTGVEETDTAALNTPIHLTNATVTLTEVTPAPRSTTTILDAEYRFTFTVVPGRE